MGIKSLTQTVKKNSPDSITHENLYKLHGKKVAVDASLIIYQQLFNTRDGTFFRNNEGKITNHITGVFFKIMNYISLNIELIFIFDGKPPDNKSDCIKERKKKAEEAIKLSEITENKEEKQKLEKYSTRLTKEMIDDIKHLLHLLGISYIEADGEGEAYASELCRIGQVDYVLTEDMDSLVYGCPKLIRNCVDRSIKRKDIISIFDYNTLINDLQLTEDKFIDFCILCGCDYCSSVPKLGNISALKLVKKHNTIEEIINNTNYLFPENYIETFHAAKHNFLMYKNKLDINKLNIHKSLPDVHRLRHHLINNIQMNETRVNNALKKFHNNYQDKSPVLD